MSDVFLSYAEVDKATAAALAEALQDHCSVWWDRKIPPGRSFDEVIEEAIESAKCVIVLWSRASVASDWVKAEADEGLRRNILVPALIEDVRIPLGFRRIQAADLTDWRGSLSHIGFDEMIKAVTAILSSEEMDIPEIAPHTRREIGEAKRQYEKSGAWRSELVSTSLRERTIRVFLTRDVHVLQFRRGFSARPTVKIDGKLVAEGKRRNDEHVDFEIGDGDALYAGTIDMSQTFWAEGIKTLRLTIAGHTLYRET